VRKALCFSPLVFGDVSAVYREGESEGGEEGQGNDDVSCSAYVSQKWSIGGGRMRWGVEVEKDNIQQLELTSLVNYYLEETSTVTGGEEEREGGRCGGKEAQEGLTSMVGYYLDESSRVLLTTKEGEGGGGGGGGGGGRGRRTSRGDARPCRR